MSPPSKQEQAAADKAWQKAVVEHAEQVVTTALIAYGTPVSELGGLVAHIAGPDGVPRRFYVRLTEVRQ